MSFFNVVIGLGSRVWRSVGVRPKCVVRMVNRFTNLPVQFGLSFEYGKLYGATIHNKLHNPELETVAFFKKEAQLVNR